MCFGFGNNAEALERFEKVDTLIVDKTGTLTEGKPKLIAVLPESGHEEQKALEEFGKEYQRLNIAHDHAGGDT